MIAYDVMGLSNNTKQGADIVSRALNAIVIIPDLLQGVYADPEWLPPNTDEKREKFFGYLKGYAAPQKYVEKFIEVTNECKARSPEVNKWGSYGLCWGGKVNELAALIFQLMFSLTGLSGCGAGLQKRYPVHDIHTTASRVTSKSIPFGYLYVLMKCIFSMLDPNDAKEINIPHMVLASKDEPAEPVAGFKTVIEDRSGAIVSFVETYATMFHGWMGTNAKLHDVESRDGYIRG